MRRWLHPNPSVMVTGTAPGFGPNRGEVPLQAPKPKLTSQCQTFSAPPTFAGQQIGQNCNPRLSMTRRSGRRGHAQKIRLVQLGATSWRRLPLQLPLPVASPLTSVAGGPSASVFRGHTLR